MERVKTKVELLESALFIKSNKIYYLILAIIALILLNDKYLYFDCFTTVSIYFDRLLNLAEVYIPIRSMIDETTAPEVVYFPLLIVGILFYLIILKYDCFPRWFYYTVLLCVICLHIMFILLLTICLNFENTIDFSLTFIIWITNILLFYNSCLHYLSLFWRTDRAKQADEMSKLIISGKYIPGVDILIPTYNESIEVLKRTVIGCQAIDYPRKRVFILDDGRRGEIRELANELNCSYLTRADNNNAKAGNLNCALEKTNSELIAVFDADFIPTKNFLMRTVGFFYDKKVGMVLAPQHYYNLEAIYRNLSLGSIYEMDGVFWHQMQPGKDAYNGLICSGTCFVVRRLAIGGVGGIPTDTLSEDWATSIKLQSSGYKTCYLNEILAAGDATEFIQEFIKQRVRWCQGIIQGIYSSTNPLRVKGLNLLQRMSHVSAISSYLCYLPYLGLMFVPLFCITFDVSPFKANINQMIFFGFPFYIANILIGSWISERYSSRLVGNIRWLVLIFPLALVVFQTLINPFDKIFHVTKKGVIHNKTTLNVIYAIPLIVLTAIYALSIHYAIITPSYPANEYIWILFLWCIYNLFCIWLSILALIDIPQERKALRFMHSIPCELFVLKKTYSGSTVDLSDTGAFIKTNEKITRVLNTLIGEFTISRLGLKNIKVKVIRSDNNTMGLQFINLSLKNYRVLIEYLYCQPGQWKILKPTEGGIYWECVKMIFGISSKVRGRQVK